MIKLIEKDSKSEFIEADFTSISSGAPFQRPIITLNNESYKSEETQTIQLSEFMNSNENSYENKINECMLKIFIPSETTIDISEESDKIYLIHSNQENKVNDEPKELNKFFNSIQIKKESPINFYISEKILPAQPELLVTLPKKKSKKEKVEFISKKRKNSDNHSQTSKSFPSITKIQNSKSNDSNEKIEISEEESYYKFQYRLDYYKKAFKVHCFKHLTKFLNYLVYKCPFPKELKNKKICKPNNESFTSNAKEEDNFKFLSMTLKDIYCYVKNSAKEKGISLQKNNQKLIEQMIGVIERRKNEKNNDFENLRKYLYMTMEEYIIIYYETEEFKKFCNLEKIQFYEKEFIKEKKFHMLEDYGFLRLIKMFNLNKNFSNGFKSIHSTMNGINAV